VTDAEVLLPTGRHEHDCCYTPGSDCMCSVAVNGRFLRCPWARAGSA
jgi:hypothetical protein